MRRFSMWDPGADVKINSPISARPEVNHLAPKLQTNGPPVHQI